VIAELPVLGEMTPEIFWGGNWGNPSNENLRA
jgi:hypothetical protein